MANLNNEQESGSAIVGFAMVAPLVVAVFIAVIEISMLLAQRSVLLSAAHSAARTSATLTSTISDGHRAAQKVLGDHNFECAGLVMNLSKTMSNGYQYIVANLQCQRRISWLGANVKLTATARAIDENRL